MIGHSSVRLARRLRGAVHQDGGIVDQEGIHAQMQGRELNYHLMGATHAQGGVSYVEGLIGICVWKLCQYGELPTWQTLYMWERGRYDRGRVTNDDKENNGGHPYDPCD